MMRDMRDPVAWLYVHQLNDPEHKITQDQIDENRFQNAYGIAYSRWAANPSILSYSYPNIMIPVRLETIADQIDQMEGETNYAGDDVWVTTEDLGPADTYYGEAEVSQDVVDYMGAYASANRIGKFERTVSKRGKMEGLGEIPDRLNTQQAVIARLSSHNSEWGSL